MKITKKMVKIAGAAVAAAAAVWIAALLLLRIDSQEARNIALECSGGGEVISQEISSEGLWNEYSFVIQNGNTWYDIEITGFGRVEELESGQGGFWKD